MEGAPVFFLQDFDLEQERLIRSALSELANADFDDLGNEFIHFGYLWEDGSKKRSLDDLRDLFESCDPYSPAFNAKSPGPYKFANYPQHFIAVDERALEPETPKVLMATTTDFHGEDVADDLGWACGTVCTGIIRIEASWQL